MESLVFALVFALAPVFVALFTNATKLLPVIDKMQEGPRKWTLRVICAAFAFGGVVASAAVTGVPVDPASIEAFSFAIVNFLAATGGYYLVKNKDHKALSGYNL